MIETLSFKEAYYNYVCTQMGSLFSRVLSDQAEALAQVPFDGMRFLNWSFKQLGLIFSSINGNINNAWLS